MPPPHTPSPGPESSGWSTEGAKIRYAAKDVLLLLEDNETIANLMSTVLTARLGLKVIWSDNIAAGWREFESYQANLAIVVADCRLPDGDGRVICQQMRNSLPDLPVLLTSGRFGLDNYAPLEPGKCVQFLPKPYAPAEIVDRVRQLLVDSGRLVAPKDTAGFV